MSDACTMKVLWVHNWQLIDHSRSIIDDSRVMLQMEQHALKNVNNYLNTNIYSYLETSGGQSSNLYLNVVQFFNTSVN
jgi:hypothetical protein